MRRYIGPMREAQCYFSEKKIDWAKEAPSIFTEHFETLFFFEWSLKLNINALLM